MKRTCFIISFVLFSLMLVLVTVMASSQDTIKTIQSDIKLHLNTRNAKIDTVFDYYIGISSKIIIKKFVTIDLKGSYERDNGINYLSHYENISCKYGQTGYIYDTEKDIKLFYASIYYTFKIFKAGYDYSYSEAGNHSIYLGIKWKFISAEIAFFNDVRRLKYLIEPVIKKWDKLSLKASIEGFYVPDKWKWTNGLVLNYKIS